MAAFTAALMLAGPIGHADDDAAAAASTDDVAAAFETSKALTLDELGEQRAAAKLEIDEVTINTADTDGAVVGNTAINTRSGQNTIAGDAFVGASGFIHSVQNTGNNVLIQNSTIINVSVEP